VSTCVNGVGDSAVSQLIKAGLVARVPDFYDLTVKQLESLDGFRALRARNHINAIQRTRGMPIATLILGLGIPMVGQKAAQALEAKFGTLERLATASKEDLLSIPGFGPKMATSVRQWCDREPNQRLLKDLRARGVAAEVRALMWNRIVAVLAFLLAFLSLQLNCSMRHFSLQVEDLPDTCQATQADEFKNGEGAVVFPLPGVTVKASQALPEEAGDATGPLAGVSVLITGTLHTRDGIRMTRKEAMALVVANGGRVASSVSTKTDLVVALSKPGKSKMEEARKLGVKIISQAEFWNILQDVSD